jgi:hypothetical protein
MRNNNLQSVANIIAPRVDGRPEPWRDHFEECQISLGRASARQRIAELKALAAAVREADRANREAKRRVHRTEFAEWCTKVGSAAAIERMFAEPPKDLRNLNSVTVRAAAEAVGLTMGDDRGRAAMFKRLLAMRRAAE